jgi:hypothetical protein
MACCGLASLIAVSAPPVGAIPAFAREHRLQCANCHTLVPQLNPFGEQFRDTGYRLPLALEKIPPERREADYQANLTPDLRLSERLFGRSPFSVKLTGDLRYRSRENPRTRLLWDELLLNAGGRHQRWSYYLHQHLHKGGHGGQEEYAAWIRVNDLIHSRRHSAALQVGLFELALGLSPHITRVSSLAYLPYDVSIGTADNFRLGEPELGIQLRGQLPPTWQYAAAIVTGSGLRGENNGAKDLFLRVERAVPNRPAIGLFTYLGRRELRHLGQPYQNDVRRLGVEGRWRPPVQDGVSRLHLFGMLVWGSDDRVFAADRFRDVRSFAGSLGGDYAAGPKTLLQGRLEWLGTNLPDGQEALLRLVAGLHRSIQPNLRVTLEGALTHRRQGSDGVELFLAGLWSF